jgi:hypothetical protein
MVWGNTGDRSGLERVFCDGVRLDYRQHAHPQAHSVQQQALLIMRHASTVG